MTIREEDWGSASTGCLLFLILTPITIVLNGWVLSILWRWFIVPTFSLTPLSIAQALGLTCVLRLFAASRTKLTEEDREMSLVPYVIQQSGTSIAVPLMGLLYGWIIHLFMS